MLMVGSDDGVDGSDDVDGSEEGFLLMLGEVDGDVDGMLEGAGRLLEGSCDKDGPDVGQLSQKRGEDSSDSNSPSPLMRTS